MIKKQDFIIDKVKRASHNGHISCVVWLFGLSGSGKSAIANSLEKKLFELGNHTYVLDGDNTRLGLNKDLGFTAVERLENVRRAAEVANLMAEAGLIVICSFITPYEEQRELVKQILRNQHSLQVFVDCSIETCEKRDPKGLYEKARSGEIKNFTGISDSFERPSDPDIIVNTENFSLNECVLLVAEGILRLSTQNKI
ncbi:MAG: adenylyl-sulfate kinase [Bacteroidota bacterium]